MRIVCFVLIQVVTLFFQKVNAQTIDLPESDFIFGKHELVPELGLFLGGSSETVDYYGIDTHNHVGVKLAVNYTGVYFSYNFKVYGGLTIPEIENSFTIGYRFQYKTLKFGGGCGLGRVNFKCIDDSRSGPCYNYNEGRYNCMSLEAEAQWMFSKNFSVSINFNGNINERKNAKGFGIGLKCFPFRIRF